MEMKKILAVIIASTVCALIFGALLPVWADTTASEDTFKNTGAFFVEIDPTDTYTVEYDKSIELGIVYINGKALNVPFSTGYTIVAIDNAILRLQSGDNTIQYKGNGVYITGIAKLDITVSNGSITGTFENATSGPSATWPATTYTKAFIASPEEEDYIMSTYTEPVKMNGNSPIVAFGQTSIHSSGADVLSLVNITGDIENGVTVSILNSTTGEENPGATVSDITINATTVNGYEDLYDLTSITFNVAYDGAITAVTYSAYVVPYEVTAERTVHMSGALATLVNIIPLLIAFGLIIGIAGVVIYKRM